ncbi:MAG: AMP-binding protein [Deltaproteobacteria bacterium]|nr:AMP-binding protein [Deltaproteobacteria bacterium]
MATERRWDSEGRSYAPGSRVPPTPLDRRRTLPALDVTETLRGKNLLIIGGTGFLGKVLVGLLIARYPDLGHIFLMVRSKGKMSPKERFEEELWPTPCFDPLRERWSLGPEAGKTDLYTKLTPVPGDVVERWAGITPQWLDRLKSERVHAVLNVAGVVSFDPPLDEGMRVNAVGVLNLLELCRELALVPGQQHNVTGAPTDAPMPAPVAVPLLHTSTCYVAGAARGAIWEDDPRDQPFPRAVPLAGRYAPEVPPGHGERLDRVHWDPRRELDEGMKIAAHLRARAEDAQMQSLFLQRAKAKLRQLDRPTTGEPLAQALKKEKQKFIDDELGDVGMKRAQHWGWPNTYTYTKRIGEQFLAASGQPFTIVRPAIVESSVEFPFKGWNEGINTSAPLIYLGLQGQQQTPTRPGHILDVIPVDMVCAGTVVAAAALLRGEHAMVYQLGSSDANPLTMERIAELTALYKRRYLRSQKRGNPMLNRTLARFGSIGVSPEQYQRLSAPAQAKALGVAIDGVALLKKTPAASLARAAEKNLTALQKQVKMAAFILDTFLPFMALYNYQFRCDHMRQEMARLAPADRERLRFEPDLIDWREYWNDIHIRGLRKWVFPHLEAKLSKRPRAEDRYSDLVSFLDEVAEREGQAIAVQRLLHVETKGESKPVLAAVTYKELRRRAHACASRLADVGVHPGAKVALVGKNSPEWAIAFFGILCAGGTAVPLDPALDATELGRRMRQVEASFALVDDDAHAPEDAACLDLRELVEAPSADEAVEPPEVLVAPDDVAVVAYTAGTTGASKPVVLTHKNITAVLASVAPLFKLGRRDSGLSVLPLFHTFELTCGLLLPMLRGARVTYVDAVTTEALSQAFQVAGITAMIGVPQVWEELEEKIQRDLEDSGPFAEAAYQAGVFLNRTVGRALGVNLGRVLFRPIHDRLGGRVRFLMSTGGPVPKKTAETFRSLGIELKQSYGLTEAAPVLAVGDAKGAQAVPGVEVEIRDVNEDGVGEIVARGDAVSRGYLDDDELTAAAFGKDGWLKTGDLGRIDKDGRITVVARHNEVITLADGRRIYPRGIEEQLAQVKGVVEACVVGVPDGQGGERVAGLVVCQPTDDSSAIERAVSWAARKLEEQERPSIVIATSSALPRTADRKVKRTEVIAAIVAEESRRATKASAAIAPSEVLAPGEAVAPEREPRLKAPGSRRAVQDNEAPIAVPRTVKSAIKSVLAGVQQQFYQRGLDVDIEGEENIPWNRQTLVAANHASHLDMGLVKFALGNYGRELVALAAKDYFFEGKWRRSYFENFTNLHPLDRGDNPREAMREASLLLDSGRTVLIFPEGTRTSTGEMAAFRPAVTYLALRHGIDILPIYCEGTYRSMPRGSFVPKNRRVRVHIGQPISSAALKRATEEAGLRPAAASQKTVLVVQRAVEALRDGKHFVLSRALDEALGKKPALAAGSGKGGKSGGNGQDAAGADESEAGRALREIFQDLERRFQREAVKDPLTYYFSLGEGKDAKWTVQVAKDGCRIVNDKLDGKADCVFKTDARMFTKIIKEHYIPDVSEFLDGTVKTNDPELLTTFLSIFKI